jgi:DNA-binding GntR family transcriptional regulator
MLDDLRDQTALVSAAAWRHDPTFPPLVPSWEHEAAEHRSILNAARDGDCDRAAYLLTAHITSFVQRNFPAAPEAPHQEKQQ